MVESILAQRDRMSLDNGMDLRLLSALEVLQARREVEGMAQENRERALCANACLLARALESEGVAVFASGEEVLAGLRVEEISTLARRWSAFNKEANPSLNVGEEEAQTLKKN